MKAVRNVAYDYDKSLPEFLQEDNVRTKWDVLVERQTKALEAYTKATRVLEALENTPCTCACPNCGTALYTEADFARHFVIPNEQYLNLGNCPET